MADVSKIVAALQQTLEGLGKAQNAASQAAARAQQVQTKAARTGFRAIAAGMGTVIQRLKRVQEMQNGAATSTKATAEVVQGVTADTNPEEVASTLTPAMQQLDATVTSITTILTEVDAAKTEATAALKGGKPGPMLAMLDQIKQSLGQVTSGVADAKQRTEETVAQARETGNF
jgi:uncharacterized phage infection (PIP) family protein YhgE